jgi:hypothetical protein
MESAFGIDHGEISKGVPKGLIAAAGKGNTGSFARPSMAGTWAKQGAKKKPDKLKYEAYRTNRINPRGKP